MSGIDGKIRSDYTIMTMLNQAAVEALCSATYLENYLDTMDNLPDDLQRVVTQMRELDIQCRGNHLLNIELKIESVFGFLLHLSD